jgi:hypothetical protein
MSLSKGHQAVGKADDECLLPECLLPYSPFAIRDPAMRCGLAQPDLA